MKRLRPSRWTGQMVYQARSGAAVGSHAQHSLMASCAAVSSRRCQSTISSSSSTTPSSSPAETRRSPLPSPRPERSLESAKLAALHARLSLSSKVPLQTLARALVTPSADANASFNNQNLATLGASIINYHVLEHLVCKFPRLPMAILYEALRAYSGPDALAQVARRWGTDEAAAPGEEVDPGLLQWSPAPKPASASATSAPTSQSTSGYVRADLDKYRRGISSRVVLDDDFGDKVVSDASSPHNFEQLQNRAFSSFAQAVVGAIYAHCGRQSAKAFVDSHILSRYLDLSSLFAFNLPTRELSMLCAREGFEPPLARLESETGRLSRTPVFVVGIYSGKERLGEAAGSSLDMARRKASMNALKAWYLYSPASKVRVPSEMFEQGAKPWKAPHIDIGELL
ncbi:DSRM protein [Geosmithia morbida]|uniref:Large ribosomal subunit protein mL44 n=1 Tax=Geosmithia morbida TaxID=1094350 RepID=A0A9P5D884_9HYPO|nr:DSRM protein [Geosmithia morbida]KAF4125269.1 DSRM protein [Geosmithia morbida]